MTNAITIAILLATLSPAIAAPGSDPQACPTQECEDARADRAAARAESASKSAARAAHPGVSIGLVSVECNWPGFGDAGIFSCSVTIDLPLIAVDFDCDVGVNDSGVQYIDCRDR